MPDDFEALNPFAVQRDIPVPQDAPLGNPGQATGDVKSSHNLDVVPPAPIAKPPRITSGGIVHDDPPAAGDPTEDPNTVEAEPQGGKPTRKPTAQERINRLVKRNHQATDENSALRGELARLTEVVSQLQTGSAPRPAATPSAPTAPWKQQPQGEVPPAQALSMLVEQAVAKAIQPIAQRTEEDAKLAQLQAAHERSFSEVAEEHPELRDQTSPLRQTFNALFDGRPEIAALPDAPAIVTTMALGVLGGAAEAQKEQTSRKRSAVIHKPSPIPTDTGPGPGKQVLQQVEAARARLRAGESNLEDYKLLRTYSAYQAQAAQGGR
jgi:hypothetical protein